MSVLVAVKCPHCQSVEVIRHGKSSNGKQRFRCLNTECPYQTFSLDLAYPGRQRKVKQQIVEMTMKGSGVRDIARLLHVSTATVLQELKKTRSTQISESGAVAAAPTRKDRDRHLPSRNSWRTIFENRDRPRLMLKSPGRKPGLLVQI